MTTEQISISTGSPLPLGPERRGTQINLALCSRDARSVTLVFRFTESTTLHEVELDPDDHRTGTVWHVSIDAPEREICYGYRIRTDREPDSPVPNTDGVIALDPYCRHLLPRSWGEPSPVGTEPVCLSSVPPPFDWQDDRPLKTPDDETVIYEMHVRGFTRHESSHVSAPGTFRGVVEKIPYLNELGITAVELLPITEWDETDNYFTDPDTGATLLNYWGYNPLSFFPLRSGLATVPDDAVNEFKFMVKSLHEAGIEVILDLVFNHTGESDYTKKTSGFRAIDNAVYYLTESETEAYLNYSGCGNCVSTNHPVVARMIIDSLRYLTTEFHIDGFRFDLAAVFSRGTDGAPLDNAPILDMIAEDPILKDCKIIAEAWDAVGLYQVGNFSKNPRWQEWNGRFRDDVRAFMCALPGATSSLATRIAGSSDIYKGNGKSPLNSINFITSHDGFTLYDLVSYNEKQNHRNGEQNRDGDNHNISWNSGVEGETVSAAIERLRLTRIRTFAALLLFSQGVPMINSGDELGRSQQGNNNAWCQDSDISWLDWSLQETNGGLFRFFSQCIRLRSRHKLFRRTEFFPEIHDPRDPEAREIVWQSLEPGRQDWSDSCKQLGFILSPGVSTGTQLPHFFIMANGNRIEQKTFIIPHIPGDTVSASWLQIIDTAADSPADFVDADMARRILPGSTLPLEPMALVVLQAEIADNPGPS